MKKFIFIFIVSTLIMMSAAKIISLFNLSETLNYIIYGLLVLPVVILSIIFGETLKDMLGYFKFLKRLVLEEKHREKTKANKMNNYAQYNTNIASVGVAGELVEEAKQHYEQKIKEVEELYFEQIGYSHAKLAELRKIREKFEGVESDE